MSDLKTKILVSKKEMLKEHQKLVPMLLKAGYRKEALKQKKEMVKYK